MGIKILIAVLTMALAIATVIITYIGLLGCAGALRLVRCDRCGHLGPTSRLDPLESCGYCRHDRLLHPLYAVRHAHVAYWSQHVSVRHH
ncbi:MAG: hypothetical protein ABI384_10345 [Allobranchiibius sp.]